MYIQLWTPSGNRELNRVANQARSINILIKEGICFIYIYMYIYEYMYIYIYTIVCINHVKRALNTLVEQNIYI